MDLSFPKHLCLSTYSYYRRKCSHLFPAGDSPSLQACSLPFSHRCKDGLEVFDTFSNYLGMTRKHKDSISGIGSTAEVGLKAVWTVRDALRDGPESIKKNQIKKIESQKLKSVRCVYSAFFEKSKSCILILTSLNISHFYCHGNWCFFL